MDVQGADGGPLGRAQDPQCVGGGAAEGVFGEGGCDGCRFEPRGRALAHSIAMAEAAAVAGQFWALMHKQRQEWEDHDSHVGVWRRLHTHVLVL
jgi:hypothetical protein